MSHEITFSEHVNVDGTFVQIDGTHITSSAGLPLMAWNDFDFSLPSELRERVYLTPARTSPAIKDIDYFAITRNIDLPDTE